MPEEYPAWGGVRYTEPSLKATFPNGNRDLVLRYASHAIREHDLDITLKDIRADIFVILNYHMTASRPSTTS